MYNVYQTRAFAFGGYVSKEATETSKTKKSTKIVDNFKAGGKVNFVIPNHVTDPREVAGLPSDFPLPARLREGAA
jgi:hypothetical protein